MLILNEGPDKILSDVLLAKSKLESMKNQLEILLKKKIRIDNEILILKRSIRQKSKMTQLRIKTKINLEAYDQETLDATEETREFLNRELPDVIPHFLELDQLLEEIEDLLDPKYLEEY